MRKKLSPLPTQPPPPILYFLPRKSSILPKITPPTQPAVLHTSTRGQNGHRFLKKRTCAHICPDLGSLLEIHAADVADDRGANVEPARSFRLCRVLRLDSTIASKQENWHAVRKRNQFQTHSTLQRSKFLTGRCRKHESIQKEKTRTYRERKKRQCFHPKESKNNC